MSEENAPKLRLKPKLAAEPSAVQPSSPAPAEPASPEQPAAEAPKLVRLKPKLTPPPVEEAAATPAAEPAPTSAAPAETIRLKPRLSAAPEETPAAEPVREPEPAPTAEMAATVSEPPPPEPEPELAAKPVFKLGLKAKATATSPAPAPEPPATAEGETPAVLDAPPPLRPDAETDEGEKSEPGEVPATRVATTAPFPPPGKFPPPPGLKKALDEAKEEVVGGSGAKEKKPAFKEKFFKYGVIAVLILAALAWKAGKYLLDRTVTATIENKLFDKKETAPAPAPATPQGQAVATAKTVVDQAKEQAAAPINEILPDEPKAAVVKPAESAAVKPAPGTPQLAEEVKPVAPPPPPPPSVAFRGWVENLKISGVRGGANPRIFVGGTSYQPGDLVNPQLGITFVGYSDATRMLSFRDKSGAKVERRH